MTQVPEKYKKLALARLDIVKNWIEFRKSYKNKMQADFDFIQLYNSGNQYSYLFEQTGKISRGGLHRWHQKLNNTDDWALLIPQHKYTKSSEYRTSLNDDEIKIFMNLLLHPNKISIGKAINLTKYSLRSQVFIPADITFRRYAKWFRDNNYDKWILARDGEKGVKDKVVRLKLNDSEDGGLFKIRF